jgi:hypothetical protein
MIKIIDMAPRANARRVTPLEQKTPAVAAGVDTSEKEDFVLLKAGPAALQRSRRARPLTGVGAVPTLPPVMEAVLAVPFRIRYVQTSTVAYANSVPVTRGNIASALGGVVYGTGPVDFVCWASSFRLRRLTAWPAAGGDWGCLSNSGTSTAEQALSKDSEKISVLPTGITIPVGGRVFRFKRDTFQGMWQQVVDPNDTLFEYWGTAGSVVDLEGVFTLSGAVNQGYGLTLTSGTAGQSYYLALDGKTSNNLIPQGLQTTH